MADQRPPWEKLLQAFGFNTTRLRWKWQRWQVQRERRAHARENRSRALRYKHKLCKSCGLTVDGKERRCPRCEARLPSVLAGRLARYGRMLIPEGSYSYTSVMALACVAIYLAMLMRSGQGSLFSGPDRYVALRFGAWSIPLVFHGEWWRLVTPIFIHFGLLHIIFNVLWLVQLGPVLEQTFGRSRYLVLFTLTGVGGFVFSIGHRLFILGEWRGMGGGASGMVFGLIAAGLILGYVRRPAGAEYFREGLFKWFLFGIAISFHPQIDMAAHLGGAVVGALMGLGLATKNQARQLPAWLWVVLELASLALLLVSFMLAGLHPPPLSR
ncbi:MAG: rhomboid family intramembrane serine protease [Deltaproteobacteria bacterium]|nr:rhomboid family intramembrane serine protease [Deltaproteobacteria bacterium]